MGKENIFDLCEVGDLAPECLLALKKGGRRKIPLSKRILELFSYKSLLTIDEIIVGLYREFGIIVTRMAVVGSIQWLYKPALVQKPLIKEIGGFKKFQLIKEGE